MREQKPCIRSYSRLLTAFLIVCALTPQTFSSAVWSSPAASRVSEAKIRAHIEYLASDRLQGRLAGSPGAKRAADYIAGKVRQYKLAPPPGTRSNRQAFSIISGIKLGAKNSMKWQADGASTVLSAGEAFLPIGFTSNSSVSAPVVFAGYGISSKDPSYDDYDGIDVKGNVALVLRQTPEGDNLHSPYAQYTNLRFKAINARDKGAAGLLIVAEDPGFKKDGMSDLTFDNVIGDARIPVAAISRETAEVMMKAAGTTIAAAQQAIDSSKKPHSFEIPQATLSLTCDVVKEMAQTENVMGWIEGSDPKLKDQVIIVGAHYDHLGLGGSNSLAPRYGDIHHGADDNASGSAAVLELARIIATEKPRPRRSMLFVWFSAEEEGLLGSSEFVKKPPIPLTRVVAMINLDMVGRMKNDTLIIGGAGTTPSWKPILERINQNHHFDLKLQDEGYGPSDHASFYKENLPVLFFFTGVHEDYHRPSDTADKINVADEAKVVDYVYQVIKGIDASDERPVFTKAGPAQAPQGRGFRVSLGTIPDYAAEAEGVKLSGVREGSPADKAGLKANDVIVKLGAREIKNVYEYTYALGDLEGGREVEIVVMRDGQRLALKIIPEKR